MSRLFLRQPLRMLCRASVYRNFAAESNKEKLWDKGDLRGQYREHLTSHELNETSQRSSSGTIDKENPLKTQRYDKWNDDLGYFSKKMDEDKGSARWSKAKDLGKIDVEKEHTKVAQGSGSGPNKPTLNQKQKVADNDGFDTHSAGRDSNEDDKQTLDMHAAGRLDVHYEGTRKTRRDAIFSPQKSREPGSGYGNQPLAVNTDSQWTQIGLDKEIPKSVTEVRQERSRTDVRSTINRWVDGRIPQPANLKSIQDLKNGNRSQIDKSKQKK